MDKARFGNPPSQYRPAPLWIWNDEMDKEELFRELEQLRAHGFGGAFIHPRPGLVTEYLSEEWFELCRSVTEHAERIGMKIYLYDENSYPSGFAGGHVSSQLPDCLGNMVQARRLTAEELTAGAAFRSLNIHRPGHPVRAWAYEETEGGVCRLGREVTDLPQAEWPEYGERFMVFETGEPQTNPWLGGFAYTDLLRPEVTELFLQTTYEAYRDVIGDKFGSIVPAIFTDEPEISPGNLFEAAAYTLPFSYWFAAEFERRNGYELKDHLPCLFFETDAAAFEVAPTKVRYDYYATVRELWENNFVKPIFAWCAEHSINWTGHFLEHLWPIPWGRTSPAIMSLYEYMQWPGIDMLKAFLLERDGFDGQLLNIREVHSAANQLGKERVLCEAFGAGGWDSTFEDYKRIGDWLVVNGVNFFTPHLTYSTIVGARKRDHPQSFDWRQPWWEEFTELNDYFGRLSYSLSQGRTENRILLLHPTTSIFLELPSSERGTIREWDNMPAYPGMERYVKGVQQLCDAHWDFDLGDEFILERNAWVHGTRLAVAEREYDVVIVPAAMRNAKRTTLELLKRYAANGGRLILFGEGEPCRYVDGLPDDGIRSLLPRCARAPGFEELHRELERTLEPRLLRRAEAADLPSGTASLRRVMADGSELIFIANSSPQEACLPVALAGAFVEELDLWTGEAKPLAWAVRDGRMCLDLELPSNGSRMLRVTAGPDALWSEEAGCEPTASGTGSVAVPAAGSLTVRADSPNTLPLDYCDLRLGKREYRQISTLHACQLVFEHHGFECNPWDNAVQFKRRILDRNRFDETSGFTVSYAFRVAEGGLPRTLQLLVEHGSYYELKVNGRPVSWSGGSSRLDRHYAVADLTGAAVAGDNTIELKASPFDVRLEVEPVVLQGDFGVYASGGQWLLGASRELRPGDWTKQGYPFYGQAMSYERVIRLDRTDKRLWVRLGEWEGTCAAVLVNGERAGLVWRQHSEQVEITSLVRPGGNLVEVRISGSFKNLFGPHHDPDRPRKVAWPKFWKNGPKVGQPSADAYDLIGYGLRDGFAVVSD
ncbi:glycosyl hydrolase [Cohnella cellulosilytica]|uniref:Glycosyl hydrolase n=1 Tax=Cohnella cellulosilytica TaxID=986710 RepID=A0ABW2FA90_9BACL